MIKRLVVCISLSLLLLTLLGVPYVLSEETGTVSRGEAARSIADRMCLGITPALDSFPEEEQFGILANALATRGIGNFVDTNPADTMTVGELRQIFYTVALGEGVEPDDSVNAPAALLALFTGNLDEKVTFADLDAVLENLPECEGGGVTYLVPPTPRYVPQDVQITQEERASETF